MSDVSLATPEIGHNTRGVAGDHLLSIVERWERFEEEVKALRSDQKDILAEAKGAGFDTKVLRQIFRLRKMDVAERQEADALLDLYRNVLGI